MFTKYKSVDGYIGLNATIYGQNNCRSFQHSIQRFLLIAGKFIPKVTGGAPADTLNPWIRPIYTEGRLLYKLGRDLTNLGESENLGGEQWRRNVNPPQIKKHCLCMCRQCFSVAVTVRGCTVGMWLGHHHIFWLQWQCSQAQGLSCHGHHGFRSCCHGSQAQHSSQHPGSPGPSLTIKPLHYSYCHDKLLMLHLWFRGGIRQGLSCCTLSSVLELSEISQFHIVVILWKPFWNPGFIIGMQNLLSEPHCNIPHLVFVLCLTCSDNNKKKPNKESTNDNSFLKHENEIPALILPTCNICWFDNIFISPDVGVVLVAAIDQFLLNWCKDCLWF